MLTAAAQVRLNFSPCLGVCACFRNLLWTCARRCNRYINTCDHYRNRLGSILLWSRVVKGQSHVSLLCETRCLPMCEMYEVRCLPISTWRRRQGQQIGLPFEHIKIGSSCLVVYSQPIRINLTFVRHELGATSVRSLVLH